MKNQNVKIEKKTGKKEISLDAKNVESVKQISVKKFKGIDYETLTAKEQKRLRAEKRNKLFKIIDAYCLMKLKKELNEANKKESFETFKSFVKENYEIPLSECENVFKGAGQKKIDFEMYVSDFKTYLQKK